MNKLDLTSLGGLNGKHWLTKTMLWLVVACGGLLFGPQALLEALNLNSVVQSQPQLLGLGLIIGAAYFVSRLLNFLLDEAICYLGDRRAVETIEKKVRLLDPAERALLREFFLQGATILTLPKDELAVKSLVATNILECLGNERHYAIQGSTADYKISMKARIYLNRDVLRLPAGEPSQEELQQLIRTRPSFVTGLVQARKPGSQRAA
ncbi:superinfection exclusion B family protein [Shewanella cyperi]|uniref:Superinfection exclusion B family protein n=1 Tax=Shewanella cyperi TaxID=2814292 RepID=A0A975AKK4_9GAMM|nr:superinfection exclusion B family protein [Shewanella cyperi]QSX30462.1 superinfection exclusion B family protein [Shewanella cyperi]QSX41236.1 superinfection exclusion B family protein [Shewanella cyperi]